MKSCQHYKHAGIQGINVITLDVELEKTKPDAKNLKGKRPPVVQVRPLLEADAISI